MTDQKLPKVANVEVIGAQPKPADMQRMNFIKANEDVDFDPVTYIVKVELDEALNDAPISFGDQGFMLYVGDLLIEKYAGYQRGIFFKVYDPRFLQRHAGQEIRLSVDGETFFNTGKQLPHPATNDVTRSRALPDSAINLQRLPTQEEVLK